MQQKREETDMSKKMLWGLGVLVLLICTAFVFMTVRNTSPLQTKASNIDWKNPTNVNWHDPKTLESYRAFWGEDPPWNGEFQHIRDSQGKVRRFYRNKPLVTNYNIRIDFVPTPKELRRYKDLQEAWTEEQGLGNINEANRIMMEMQELVNSAQGEIPIVLGISYYGDKRSPEEIIRTNNEAIRELYEFMEIEHLFNTEL